MCALQRHGGLKFIHSFPLACLQWNKPSIDFYELSLGAKPMSEWLGMRLEEEGIDNLIKFTVGGRELA